MISDGIKNTISSGSEAFGMALDFPTETPEDKAARFENMLQASNEIMQKNFEKEKNSFKNGTLEIGETKSDKDFREQLEKITGKSQTKAKNKMDQADYLNLLVTELKYQDPTKPMDNHQMASQMAQFNSVQQLLGINKLLTEIKNSQTQTGLEKLSQYLGKQVEIEGNMIVMGDKGEPSSVGRFNLPSSSATTAVEIVNSGGAVVKRMTLGALSGGSHVINWDGTDDQGQNIEKGNYTFRILASDTNGKPMPTKVSYETKVNGITDFNNGGKLETPTGTIELSQINAIRMS